MIDEGRHRLFWTKDDQIQLCHAIYLSGSIGTTLGLSCLLTTNMGGIG